MKVHNLKTIQPYFGQLIDGSKTFELRKNDRDYEVGDILKLFEGIEQVDDIEGRINKNFVHFQICYKLEGGVYGLDKEYCVLGISRQIIDYDGTLNNLKVEKY